MIYSGHSDNIFALAFSPVARGTLSGGEVIGERDGQYMASGGRDKTVQVWDARSGLTFYTYHGHANVVLSLAWSPDGRFLASGCTDGVVQVWEALSGNTSVTYRGHVRFVRSVAWSPDGQYIASGGDFGDSTVQVWEAATGKHIYTHSTQNRIFALGWSLDGIHIASASFDGTVQIWDALHGTIALTCRVHGGPVYTLAWSPVARGTLSGGEVIGERDGTRIASGGQDATVHVWNAAHGNVLSTFIGHSGPVKTLAWSPVARGTLSGGEVIGERDGRYIVSAGDDTTVQVWDTATGRLVSIYDRHTSWVRAVAWSPDGQTIASASDKLVHMWEPLLLSQNGKPFLPSSPRM